MSRPIWTINPDSPTKFHLGPRTTLKDNGKGWLVPVITSEMSQMTHEGLFTLGLLLGMPVKDLLVNSGGKTHH